MFLAMKAQRKLVVYFIATPSCPCLQISWFACFDQIAITVFLYTVLNVKTFSSSSVEVFLREPFQIHKYGLDGFQIPSI